MTVEPSAAVTDEAVEAAAIALYEASRDPHYSGEDWDWPNIDRSYDKPDETVTDPEWARNEYRAEARAALAAALPILRAEWEAGRPVRKAPKIPLDPTYRRR